MFCQMFMPWRDIELKIILFSEPFLGEVRLYLCESKISFEGQN